MLFCVFSNILDLGKEDICFIVTTYMGASITYGLPGFYQRKIPFEDDYKEKYYKQMSKFSTKRKQFTDPANVGHSQTRDN